MWPVRRPDEPEDQNACPHCGTPEKAPEAPQGAPAGMVSLLGTREEKLARFGPPVDRKDLPPLLVSLGEQQRRIGGAGRQPDRTVTVEAFMDRRANVYYRWAGDTGDPQPANVSHGKEDKVVESFSVPLKRDHVSPYHSPAPPDSRTVLPGPTPEEAAALRVMFGTGES